MQKPQAVPQVVLFRQASGGEQGPRRESGGGIMAVDSGRIVAVSEEEGADPEC